MAHELTHYKLLKDGKLVLVRTEIVEDPPRTRLDFSSLAFRDIRSRRTNALDAARFESLVDDACEDGGVVNSPCEHL